MINRTPTRDQSQNSYQDRFITSPATRETRSMSAVPNAMSQARLAAYAAEATQQRLQESRHDLTCKVQYICNDLELILGELNSPSFMACNGAQQHSLAGSRAAIAIAMHELRKTTQAVGDSATS